MLIHKAVAFPLEVSGAGARRDTIQQEVSARASRSHQKLSTVAATAVVSLAVVLLLMAGGLIALRTHYRGEIFPSVAVADRDLGGSSPGEARQLLAADAEFMLGMRMTFTYGGQRWNPTLAELGVSADVDRSVAHAFEIGREADARTRLQSTLSLLRQDRRLPMQFVIDEVALASWADTVDRAIGPPPADASISISGGKVTLAPETDGTVIDRAAIRVLVTQSLATLSPYAGDAPTIQRVASVRAGDLTAEVERLQRAVAAPVSLTYGRRSWEIAPGELDSFIVTTVTRDSAGAAKIDASFDLPALAAYFDSTLRAEIDRDPLNATVAWDLNNERLMTIEKSRNGVILDAEALAANIAAAFWDGDAVVSVPVSKIKPLIDSNKLDALGITTKLSVGDSNFDGSDFGRATNVAVGAQLLNGTLVPPGGEFSFNHAIGEITVDLGYVEAGVVDGERIGKDIGGGICQVSTTVFRAVFYAGLPITEWNPHRYRLGFYEQDGWSPGLDASILQPEEDPFGGGDFRFTNPSDSWLLIESYSDGARVYVIIYGPDLEYTVDVAGPYFSTKEYPPTADIEIIDEELPPGTIQQTEYALEGMDVYYDRKVYDAEGNLLWERTFGTHFYPRGDAYKVSPDMKGQSPAARSED